MGWVESDVTDGMPVGADDAASGGTLKNRLTGKAGGRSFLGTRTKLSSDMFVGCIQFCEDGAKATGWFFAGEEGVFGRTVGIR